MTDHKENARIEAFSDGVFAIAITLLILEIKVPPLASVHSTAELWGCLKHLWPSYVAFVYSFGITLVMWVNHHNIFNLVDKTSRPFMYANGFLLLSVTFIPFPTALIAEYIATDYLQPSVVVYCITSVILNIGFNLLIESILRPKNLLKSSVNMVYFQSFKKSTRWGLVIYAISLLIALWFPVVALIINLSLWLLWISLSLAEKLEN